MKLITLILLVGMLAVSGWADLPFSEDLIKKAEAGDADAQSSLGQWYQLGIEIPGLKTPKKDMKEAVKWYTKAAEQGQMKAQFRLGRIYLDGGGEIIKDEKEGIKWFMKAAEQGDAASMNSMGVCYLKGSGVPKDEKEAVKWHEKAAAKGDECGLFSLAVCYNNGLGVPKDEKEALKWFLKAAESGSPGPGVDAQRIVGDFYKNGTGIAKDEKEAIKWYTKAATQGDEEAKKQLELLKSTKPYPVHSNESPQSSTEY